MVLKPTNKVYKYHQPITRGPEIVFSDSDEEPWPDDWNSDDELEKGAVAKKKRRQSGVDARVHDAPTVIPVVNNCKNEVVVDDSYTRGGVVLVSTDGGNEAFIERDEDPKEDLPLPTAKKKPPDKKVEKREVHRKLVERDKQVLETEDEAQQSSPETTPVRTSVSIPVTLQMPNLVPPSEDHSETNSENDLPGLESSEDSEESKEETPIKFTDFYTEAELKMGSAEESDQEELESMEKSTPDISKTIDAVPLKFYRMRKNRCWWYGLPSMIVVFLTVMLSLTGLAKAEEISLLPPRVEPLADSLERDMDAKHPRQDNGIIWNPWEDWDEWGRKT